MTSKVEKTATMFSDTDLFPIYGIDHLEFFVGDVHNTSRCFKYGFGMTQVAHTNRNLHNYIYTSNILQTGNVKFIFTSPYLSDPVGIEVTKNSLPNPTFDAIRVRDFVNAHGNGVGVLAIRVGDAKLAYDTAMANGAVSVVPVTEIADQSGGKLIFAEILLYDDDLSAIPSHMTEYAGLPVYQSSTALRFVQRVDLPNECVWPGYKAFKDARPLDYGIHTIDHVVGNVYRMDAVVNRIKKLLGLHTFAFFTEEDIRTDWTSLNSEVLASNDARMLMPINEPAPGKAESQILTYLRYFNGPGVQHIALKSSDIFKTLKSIRETQFSVDFLEAPDAYYDQPEVLERLSVMKMTPEQIQQLKELSILIDLDEHGCLLQIFTKPLFDRPTVFIEIIQRICYGDEIPGCGRFGNGNFKALFISLEPLLNPNIPK